MLLAVFAPGCSWEYSHSGLDCPPGSEWPRTGDALWLRYRLEQTGISVTGCTGSAYVVRMPGAGEVYVWAFGPARRSRPPTEDARWVRETVGTRLHGNDLRAVWIADGRYVWVEAGPTAATLPSLKDLAPLVAATVRRGAPPG